MDTLFSTFFTNQTGDGATSNNYPTLNELYATSSAVVVVIKMAACNENNQRKRKKNNISGKKMDKSFALLLFPSVV